MKKILAVSLVGLAILWPNLSCGYEVAKISVAGDKEASIGFSLNNGNGPIPSLKIDANVLELSFIGATLADDLLPKVEMASPHLLVRRVSAYMPAQNIVRARVVLNGSLERLKDRVRLTKDGANVALNISYPTGDQAALDLLKEEQKPFQINPAKTETHEATNRAFYYLMVLLLVALASAGLFFALRYFKTKTPFNGSRKFLIERLAYTSLGPKMGVALVKVGREFMLLGVTPGQVSLLSTLPKLSEAYEGEAAFERDDFKQVVSDEYGKIGLKAKGPMNDFVS